MFQELKPAIRIFLIMTVLTGALYPLCVTGVAQVFFGHEANGSLVRLDGKIVGSELIGQSFSAPRYFWGRLSATSPAYNAAASSGSNCGPLHASLKEAVQGRMDALKSADPGNTSPVPVDLVTASGSGLDPHISLAAAYYQLPRVARERGLPEDHLKKLIQSQSEGRFLGFIGEPVVNVLRLNLVMDSLQQSQSLDYDTYRQKDNLPKFMKWGPIDRY